MSTEDQGDKQYEASQTKLDEARKKGEIAKSADLTTAAAYIGLFVAFTVFGASSLTAFATALRSILDHLNEYSLQMFDGSPAPSMGGLFWTVAISLSALFLLPAIFALTSLIVQKGIVFAPSRLEPKLNRISPISGAKNKFGRKGLFEFAKSSSKLCVYCAVLGVVITLQMDTIVGSYQMSPMMVTVQMGRLFILLLGIVMIVATAIGVIDFIWQRAEHLRKHRMSRKEMTDEQKQAEGDPHLKQQRRQKGVELAMNQMLADVPKADVIIVNPTHYAIALKWDRGSVGAPVCVAKGVDEIARKIRELAAENAIPLHSDPPTARALYAGVEIGEQIRPQDFAAVAAAIRFAESIQGRARHE